MVRILFFVNEDLLLFYSLLIVETLDFNEHRYLLNVCMFERLDDLKKWMNEISLLMLF